MRSALAYLLLLCLSFLKGADPVALSQQNTVSITGTSSVQSKIVPAPGNHQSSADLLNSSFLCEDDNDDEFEPARKKTALNILYSIFNEPSTTDHFPGSLKTVLTKQFAYSPPDKTIFKRSLLV